MKKHVVLLILLSVSIISYSQGFQKIRGNGNVTTQDRQVEDFREIHSAGSFDVIITDGAERSVKVEAEDNIQPYIEVAVRGNALTIHSKKGYNINSTRPIKIFVTATSIQSIRSSGSGNVNSENQLHGSKNFEIALSGSGNATIDVETTALQAAISGSGNITLKGKTEELEGMISGSGNIRAKQLQSSITALRISGSGGAEVVATKKLDSKIAGSGDVKYWGDAVVESKIAGSGKVRKEN